MGRFAAALLGSTDDLVPHARLRRVDFDWRLVSFPVGVCKGDAFVTPVLAGARARAEHRRLHDLVHWRMWDSIDYCEYPPPARWGWNISDTRTIPEGSARLIGLSGQLDSPGLASLAALAALVSLV